MWKKKCFNLFFISVSLFYVPLNPLSPPPHLSSFPCIYTHNVHSLYFYVFLVFSFSSLHLLYLSLNFPLWSPPWQSPTPPTPDHIHMLIIKSPPAPPHLWGNPLAGHPCLSDKEQHRCFILTSLLVFLLEHFLNARMYDGLKKEAWPWWDRYEFESGPTRNRCGI